jgi:hypothetical protein
VLVLALRHVQIRFVQGQRLHRVGEGVENLHNVSRDDAIDLETRREKYRLRAQPDGCPGGHSGVNLELPCLVGTARNDASPIRGSTDDHCSTAQFRAIPLFDRCIKGIYVEMDDGTVLWHSCHSNAMHAHKRVRNWLPL